MAQTMARQNSVLCCNEGADSDPSPLPWGRTAPQRGLEGVELKFMPTSPTMPQPRETTGCKVAEYAVSHKGNRGVHAGE